MTIQLEGLDGSQPILSANTRAAYAHDWVMFARWCGQVERVALPATTETVIQYCQYLLDSERKLSTAIRRTTGITYQHRLHGFTSPVDQRIWNLFRNAQRLLGEVPEQKTALSPDEIRAINRELLKKTTPCAVRDRALVLVGFASALRRSNLVELRLADTALTAQGLVLHVRHEKNDPQHHGRYLGVPYGRHRESCPVRALRAWLSVRGKEPGPLFTRFSRGSQSHPLTPQMVALVVKRAVRLIGLDPRDYAGHSLRSGFVTAAAEAGAGELLIASQTGHRSMEVLRRYFRRTNLFRANAAGMLGL